MNVGQAIKAKFSEDAIGEMAGEMLFEGQDALEVVAACEELGVIIIGMDFWQQRGGNIVEINSTDYSSINALPDAPKKTIEAARELLKNGLPDNADYVSFILQ